MAALSRLLEPMSEKEFYREFMHRQPLARPHAARDYCGLLDDDIIKDILRSHDNCWMVRRGVFGNANDRPNGRVEVSEFEEGFARGQSLVFRHAEQANDKIGLLARDFETQFRRPVDVQVYVTPAGEEGFDWHYDLEEVFVLQCRGEKEFRLRQNTISPNPVGPRLPKNLGFEKEPPAAELRCLLKAGDWLYIPSGYWHKARALTNSAHISVGVMPLTALEFFKDELDEKSPLRGERIPIHDAELASPVIQKLRREIYKKLKS